MPSRKVKAYLDGAGVKYDVIEHPIVYTAQEIAAVTHVKGKELAKAVIVKADGEIVMLALPATRKINFETLKGILGSESMALAKEEDFVSLFPDCETGAMPPFGKLYNIPVIVDQSLNEDKDVVFNAGTHHDIIRISFEDFKRLESPRIAAFTIHI